MIHTDIVVIGAGPVGLFTIFQAGMLGFKCHVVDSLDDIGGQCTALYPEKPIYDIPAHPAISGGDLIAQLEKQATPFAPVFHLGQTVTHLQKNNHESLTITTSKQAQITAKAVIIAAGAGAFGPNRPPLDGIENFEGTSVFYYVKNPKDFAGKHVMIAGGGDSAIDWVNHLAPIASHVTLVHRRDKFRAALHSVDAMRTLNESGDITLKTGYQLYGLNGSAPTLESIDIATMTGEIETIKADCLLPFYGLSNDLGALEDWGFEINNKHITVDPITQMTSINGVYAIGDICDYSDKLKLILTGFAEAATACHHILKRLNPDQDFHFEYSTTKGIPSAS